MSTYLQLVSSIIPLCLSALQAPVKEGAVDRLTDTSKYTGSHKQRFDQTGQGKGLEGRHDFDDKASAGYVGGYKGQGKYDSKK